jgi:redox-regulated HSP33 family molecular chaperone
VTTPPNKPLIRPVPRSVSLLTLINELDSLQFKCNCSLEKMQEALEHLKAINEKVDNKTTIDI